MATADPLDGQPPSLQDTILADSFISIIGATWFKPAGRRKKRRNEPLIETNKRQCYIFHPAAFPLLEDLHKWARLNRSSMAWHISA
jgi:hypothetical protein